MDNKTNSVPSPSKLTEDSSYDYLDSWFQEEKARREKEEIEMRDTSPKSITQRMQNIVSIYRMAWKKMLPTYTQMYAHDPAVLNKIQDAVETYIANKIKIDGDGKQLICIGWVNPDDPATKCLTISGLDKETYEKCFKRSMTTFKRMVQYIVDELKECVVHHDSIAEYALTLPSFIKEHTVVTT